MKTPDVIYVEFSEDVNLAFEEQPFEETPAYIRKDTLLEWAKEVNDSGPIKDSADKGDAWSIGYLCGMRDIIDKLNSI